MAIQPADAILRTGRLFFATALVAFGIQHLVYCDFVTRVVPSWPTWLPPRPVWAWIVGAGLIAFGGIIAFGRRARLAALLLAVLLFTSFLLLHLPAAAAGPLWGGAWTNAGKVLALCGGALALAGSLQRSSGDVPHAPSRIVATLERALPLARFFLGAFLVLCGIQHFLWVEYVVPLVPRWIPQPFFWAYFAGVALIAGGAGLMRRKTAQLAAALSGLMIFLWVILLHIPRALADLHNSNETTAVFEALALSGIALVLACGERTGLGRPPEGGSPHIPPKGNFGPRAHP